jgi:hypothetical protein
MQVPIHFPQLGARSTQALTEPKEFRFFTDGRLMAKKQQQHLPVPTVVDASQQPQQLSSVSERTEEERHCSWL